MTAGRLVWGLAAFFAAMAGLTAPAAACLSGDYARLSVHCKPQTAHHRLMSLIFDDFVKPRQIAVVAGISDYPNLAQSEQLPPAAQDIAMMTRLFTERLQFDEVIVLKNEDFNTANIRYIFQVYLPDVLLRNEKSRVVFTYSGHGQDFAESGYLFFHDTPSIKIESYSDTAQAIDLEELKLHLKKTFSTSQHFLALINSCKGGHFLNQSYAFGVSPLEEKGAHGITAGGADDTVYARENVGTGKGSVFFEMVAAAFSGQGIELNGQRFDDPSGDDGILTTSELSGFLIDTIKVVEDYKIIPRSGRLRPSAPGRQGEMFFIVDKDKAQAALSRRFPKRVQRLFGSPDAPATKPDATLDFLNDGFAYPPAGVDEENPDLITIERILSGDYEVINDQPWRRKVAVASNRSEFFHPRAATVNGRLSILFLAKEDNFNPGSILLREFFPDTNTLRTVDTLPYEGGGYFFDSDYNLKIDGDRIYYFASDDDFGRVYHIGSGAPARDFRFTGERDSTFAVSLAPNGRYAVTGDTGGWVDEVYQSAPEIYRLTVDNGSGTEFTGISLYNRENKTRNILFKQEYTGDWSIGRVIWADDSAALYFDNSGAVACIWKYDIAERRLQKIVPEHEARQPFFLRYGGKDYVLYTDQGRIMIATQ